MNPSHLLSTLIRFDTSNPPGNEKDCILWIKDLLDKAGLTTALFARDPQRPNLVARLKGRGSRSPLLFYGHVDVVAASDTGWAYPPFSGEIADGFIWGRGALDMKGGIAMMLSAILSVCEKGIVPAGDILFCALSDEEAGGDFGAGFMVSNHPEQFEGVRYAVGEFGGFPFYIGKTCFYPIQTGEKQVCWMKGRVNGKGGHGSQNVKGNAMAKLGRIISILDRKKMPVHITPLARDMIQQIADHLTFPAAHILKLMLNPLLTNTIIGLLGEKGAMFDPLLHHTANVTMVHGGDKVNVIPSQIEFEMDGRILPGFTAHDFIKELKTLVGGDLELEIIRNDPGSSETDMGLFPLLEHILKDLHPGAVPIPMLLSGMTDARYFSRLGIQSYGFIPLALPPSFQFNALIHAVDERVPTSALGFGVNALETLIRRMT